MVGSIITDPKTGEPLDSSGNKLTKSKYSPPFEVKQLFARVQKDYQHAYMLKNKSFDEFDGHSLMQRMKLDQETFAAFVGVEYVSETRAWRWRGRKNTARNKLIGILAHLIAGMLYPFVYAQNEQNEEDKMTARAMRILVEDKLKKVNYELKFFYMVLCALVNPAIVVQVEYVEVMQTIRRRRKDGSMSVEQMVDEMLSGLFMHIVPLDEILFGDYFVGTANIQGQPCIFRARRLGYDQAREIHSGKHFYKRKDLFDYVTVGQNKVIHDIATQGLTLFDIDADEGDENFVQELTVWYLRDDLQLTWVGDVGMFNHEHPYDNPFEHRRMTVDKKTGEYYTAPVYPIAMSGFEPIDPAGRFLWFKSGAFKEFWEDKKITELDRMMVDGIKLDIFKPMFLSGMTKVDQEVMVPGATVGMPQGTTATPYSLGPNLVAGYNAVIQAAEDMSESTQDKIMQGQAEKGVTATATIDAQRNARIFLGVFGFMTANLIKQVGELVMDCTIMYDTVGELEALSSSTLTMKYKTYIARGKDHGREITNKIIFTDQHMGRNISEERAKQIELGLYKKTGGKDGDQRIWMINPYRFARTRFSMYMDADRIVMRSMGMDRIEKDQAFERLSDPRVLPFTDPEAVASDFVIEEYGGSDPERYKRKQSQDELINALLGQTTDGQSKRSNLATRELTTT